MDIRESLQTLLQDAIDYAGLFPPANLSLEESIANYIKYLQRPERWMLARFVIPAARLDALGPLLGPDSADEPVRIAALGRSGTSREEFLAGLAQDLAEIQAFRGAHGANARVEVFETRLPGEELDYQIRADHLIHEAAGLLQSHALQAYFEVPFDTDWQTRAGRTILALSESRGQGQPGFKLRTGGLSPDRFPSPQQIAWALLETNRADIPMKCTAGLHHPFRHFNAEIGARMHGFINVLIASTLAGKPGIGAAVLEDILRDEDPASFQFEYHTLSWKSITVSLDELKERRSRGIASFGSCSFLEPLGDLRALNLL